MNYTLNYVGLVPSEKRSKSSEITHLLLDIMACPFVDISFKKKFLILYRNDQTETIKRKTREDAIKIASFVKYQKYWFTKWERLDLFKEFESKKSQEVYS